MKIWQLRKLLKQNNSQIASDLTGFTVGFVVVVQTLAMGSIFVFLEVLASSPDETGSAGGDETTLLTARSIAPGGRGVTHVLMVTTTMGMLDGVHGNTSDAGPVLLLGMGLVVGSVRLEEGLVAPLATGDNTDHGTRRALDGLADA